MLSKKKTSADPAKPAPKNPAVPISQSITTPPHTPSPANVPTPPAPVAAAPVRDRSGIIALIGKLRHYQADIARNAAVTLGHLRPDTQAIDALAAVVRNRDGYYHAVVRAAAATSLGKLGDRRAVDALIDAIRDPMAEASDEAVKALGLLGDPRSLPAIEAVIKNYHGYFLENVRRTAQEAARRIATKPQA